MPCTIQHAVSLAEKNWFRTGGAARFYTEPTTIEEFQDALKQAHCNNWNIYVLGEGANCLVSDEGFDGLVIRPCLNNITVVGTFGDYVHIRVGAGVSFGSLIDYCLNNDFVGLEEFSGIPGTVGGAVFINIHYFEFLLSHFFVEGTVIDRSTQSLLAVDHTGFAFGYNYSLLHTDSCYLTHAVFKVKKVSSLEAMYARGRQREILRHRHQRYPTERTCGSFFRNFHDDEVTFQIQGKKILNVAYYFDKLGIKGDLSKGNAFVSHKHANMIVSKEHSTSSDIIGLAYAMQTLAKERFALIPQPECRFVGFKKYPLL